MGFSKTWTARLSFNPPLDKNNLEKVVEYIGDCDYSIIVYRWETLPVKRRTKKNDKTWGNGAMHKTFKQALDNYNIPICNISWYDERNGGNTSYECQDIGKLLRILRKLQINTSGEVEGEGFAYNYQMFFIIDNMIRAPRSIPGDIIFRDDCESDQGENDFSSEISKKAKKETNA